MLSRLLHGSEDENTVFVRRKVFDTLGRVIKHSVPNVESDQAVELIMIGMGDKDRAVRLKAG